MLKSKTYEKARKSMTGWTSKWMLFAMASAVLVASFRNAVRLTLCSLYAVIGSYPVWHYRSLTPKRVTALLAAKGALANASTVVTAVEWIDIESGAVGTVRRIKLTYNQADSKAPGSLVVKALGVTFKVWVSNLCHMRSGIVTWDTARGVLQCPQSLCVTKYLFQLGIGAWVAARRWARGSIHA